MNSWDQKYPVFVKHGGKYAFKSDVESEGVIADYTALLIGHELDLIPAIEKTFSRIVIPPSLLVVLQADVHKARHFQPSRLQSLQHVKAAMDAEKISVSPDLINDDLLSPFQVEEIGISGARLFYLAEKSGGMVLAKHLGRSPETDSLLDKRLTTKRVFPREVLTALWRLGAVAQAELQTAVDTHLDESCRDNMVDILLLRPPLITDHLTLEYLALLGVLDRVSGMFSILVPKTEAEYFRQSLHVYDLRQSIAERLDELRRHISERLGKNYHFPSFSMEIDEKELKGPNVLLLEEVCRIAQVEKLPVWIDDRFIHQYERMEQSPLLSTMDLLALLKQRRTIPDEEYFQYVNRLLELKPQFYPLDGEAVRYFLSNAQRSDSGSIRESYELKVIRRYFAGNFLQDTALCRSSPDARKLPELALYYQNYQASCRALLADIWCSDAVVEDKEAYSRWIVGRLWKGIEEIRHLLPKPPSLLDSVAVSEFTLLGIAFEILLREMPKTEISSLYLHWLYDHFLAAHWMNNPSVKELVIKRAAAFLKDMIERREEQLRGPLTALYASALGKGPFEISEALITRESLREIFKDYVQQTVQISDELRISVDTWREWVFETIAALPGTAIDKRVNERILCLKWQEPSPFLAGLTVQFTSDDEKVNRHTRLHQFIKLYHPLSQARETAADAILPFLAVSTEKKTKLRSGITRQFGYETVAEEMESIAETSWDFFWGRLTSFLQAGVPIDLAMLFPKDASMFVAHYRVLLIASADLVGFRTAWREFMVERSQTYSGEMLLKDLMVFPFGEDISAAEILDLLVTGGSLQACEIVELVLKLARTTANPIVLENCLDVLLASQKANIQHKAEIEAIISRLLNAKTFTDSVPLESLYNLYISAMHFAWRRMEALEPFKTYSAEARTICAYAYAGALLNVADELRENQNVVLDYEALSRWLKGNTEASWNTIFQGTFDEQLDVSHPSKVEWFRTIVCGTLAVLVRHRTKLDWIRHELLGRVISIAKDVAEGKLRGGEEILKPFRSTRNIFGSYFNKNFLSSFRTILELYEEDTFAVLRDAEQQLIKFVKETDPVSELKLGLDKTLNAKKWELSELVLVYNAVDEPLSSIDPALLKDATAYLDLSICVSDQNFSLACETLARCVNAINDCEMRQQVLKTLENAWIQVAKTPSNYLAILSAVLLICSNSRETDNAANFYGWWQDALLKTKTVLPETVFEFADSLKWSTEIKDQGGLFQVRGVLATLG
ncbi:MAG: hypothetical protein WD688_24440 [Candidatus Binatia bacterium]